jgi:signal transduction histidine kinase
MPDGRPLRPRDRRLLDDLAEQAALAFRNARLSAQLVARVELLDRRTAELAGSRARIIAARDAECARLARAIGREVTASLQSLPQELEALARAAVSQSDSASSAQRLDRMIDESVTALERLREITRGVFPTQLARSGLAPAISGHLGRSGRAGSVVVAESAEEVRFAPRIEATAYFCYLEAARDLSPPLVVTLAVADGTLRVAVDGEATTAPDLEHLRDRVEALEGAVAWERPGGTRLRLVVRIPVPVPSRMEAIT